MKYLNLYIFILLFLPGCKKYLEPGTPGTQLDDAAVFRSDATATAAMLSVYGRMELDDLAYMQIVLSGLSADELTDYSAAGPNIDLATNNLTADNPLILAHWKNWYKYIYQASAVIEGVAGNSALSPAVARQLEGEARFVRAFCYFYLFNLFGDVPLATTTDYRVNALLPRSTTVAVNNFIDTELATAITLLAEDYLTALHEPGTERVRPNKGAARALLVRQHIYHQRWQEAEALATAVLNETARYELLADLDAVFQKNSREAIWQWQNQFPEYNSSVGAQLILIATPTTETVSTELLNDLPLGDARRTHWIGVFNDGVTDYCFPFKYKVKQTTSAVTEYTMVIRLAEQYLLRSEARARLDQLPQAESDLNAVRSRAGLSPVTGLSRTALLDSIHTERRRELFGEFGDRWLDLKRLGKASQVLGPLKAPNWVVTDSLYPVPQVERLLNPQLTQNAGY